MMNEAERFQRIDELFRAARRLSPAERDAFVNEQCGGDALLAREVMDLLIEDDATKGVLDAPAVNVDITAAARSAYVEEPDLERIDRYRILSRIGEGGFGVVYLAEQDEPVRRRVALKIIKLGMDTRQVIARFEAERQALAMMDHPNIARVFDAGATSGGRPYFVMELVKGEPITKFCDEQQLSTNARLDLFIQVCHAVQHAHQKGVIHRDIKPSNVLVEMHDDRPVPKVIDFGIAKATSARLTEKTIFTEFRQLIGTPEYMSPEQAGGSALDVDTRSDIYSLGVLLYELLTGTTPFDSRSLRSAAYAEIQRIIREVEPPKPSTRLSTMGEQATAVARSRGSDARGLNRFVRGDLDWIVMKALEKNRTRRYETANEFARDIERHLKHEPVMAGPPSASYRFGKFARRHRAGLMTAALVAVALIAGVVGTVLGLVDAVKARNEESRQRQIALNEAERARQQQAIAAAVNEFLTRDILSAADLYKNPQTEFTMSAALDAASERLHGRFAEQPSVEAEVRGVISRAYRGLGQFEKALPHIQRATEILKGLRGPDDPETLTAADDVGSVLWYLGRYDQAEPIWSDTLERRRRVLGAEHASTRTSIHNLALLYDHQGKHAEAERLHLENLAAQRAALGSDHTDTIVSIIDLATVYNNQGRYAEAIPLLEEAVERYTRLFGVKNPRTLVAMGNLSAVLSSIGHGEESQAMAKRILENYPGVLPDDHPFIMATLNNLGQQYQAQKRFDEAEPMFRRAADGFRKALGPTHNNTLFAEAKIALLFRDRGDLEQARSLAHQIYQTARTAHGEDHQTTMHVQASYASVLLAESSLEEAAQVYAEVLDKAAKLMDPSHPMVGRFTRDAGLVQVRLGHYDQAETMLLRAHEIIAKALPPNHPHVKEAISALVELYEAWNRPEKVQEWQAVRNQ